MDLELVLDTVGVLLESLCAYWLLFIECMPEDPGEHLMTYAAILTPLHTSMLEQDWNLVLDTGKESSCFSSSEFTAQLTRCAEVIEGMLDVFTETHVLIV